MDTLVGYIEHIVYQNEGTGFTVAKLNIPRQKNLVCIVGILPSVHNGETVECKGDWTRNGEYGVQFKVQEYSVKAPSDVIAIEKYLASGFIKGIGPKYAKKIVELFGEKTLDIIDESPKRLREIPGIGKKRVETLMEAWEDQKVLRHVMLFLKGNDISPAYAHRILKKYGAKCVEILTDNPYLMARDIHGIGFKIADKIARTIGMEPRSSHRVCAGIEFVLYESSSQGHVCFPMDLLLKASEELLDVDHPLVLRCYEELKNEKRVVEMVVASRGVAEVHVWQNPLFYSEEGIAKELVRLKETPCSIRTIDIDKGISWVQERLKINLAIAQKDAIAQSMEGKTQIITGGPGTGKSTITQAVLALTEPLKARILLAAPTGKAAKRLNEICKRKAQTIHQLLEYDGSQKGFKRNKENPLECDLLIVDEASMIDTFLMFALLKAIPSYARVIFVGDIDQLPSVGPGNVLRDLINSKEVPVTCLTEIFRQAAGSKIITNAHRINKGIFPELTNKINDDFFFIEAEEPQLALEKIIHLVKYRLPTHYRFHPIKDIQVLSPMRKGGLGIENLNLALQEALNPQEEGIKHFGRMFCMNDKVMQLKNNYQKEVYNGDVGTICDLNFVDNEVIVQFDDKICEYTTGDMEEITHAYAVSIHKYQGSESPCIVMPIHTTHFKLLFRNLLYTGITRGKKLVVLVGMKKAIAIAVNQDEVKKRYTGLVHQIQLHLQPSFI
jgi:exodeoxyribonuclease V alpha subunit